jgi:co-chaperonin GroES (HSP10)
MSSLQPRNDFVLLEEAKAEPYHTYKQYEHIVVPSKYEHGPEDRPILGKILAKGEACVNARMAVGAIAMAGKWAGARFQREGTNYVIVKEVDIFAVLE